MVWIPFRRAWHNPIFHGGLEAFAQQPTHRSYSLNYVAALATVLLITWPKEGFVNLRDLPFTYNALGGTTLIILAYLNMSQGAVRSLGSRYLSLHDWLALAPVPAGTFLRGYLAASCLELLVVLGAFVTSVDARRACLWRAAPAPGDRHADHPRVCGQLSYRWRDTSDVFRAR